MSTFKAKDANALEKDFKSFGSGTTANPYIPYHLIDGYVNVTGSVTANLGSPNVYATGTVNIGNTPIPVTDNGGSLTVDGYVTATGTVSIAGTVSVDDGGNSITVDGSVNVGNTVTVSDDGAFNVTVDNASLTIDGAVFATGTVNIGNTPIPVTDNGGSLTIDASSLPLPTGAATAANQLPDGHNVTIDNASGASAVNIQDGGNSITVDGTVDLGATDNAVLDQIELNTSYGDNTGGGTEAGSLRVTLANDSTGLISVDDNAGSLTVDNANIDALQFGVQGESNSLAVVHATGTTVSVVIETDNAGIGGGVQYTEDDPSAGGETGTFILGVRNDAGTTPVSTDGDYHGIQFDNSGRLRVVTQGGAGGTSSVDEATFTLASDSGTPAMGYVGQDSLATGTVGVLGMTADRQLRVVIDADNAGIGGGTQYTEDDAAAANPIGGAQILVRQDTPATLVTTDGDNVARRGTNYGAAFSQIVDSSGNFVDTFGGGTQYTEDAASVADPVGNQLIARRRDTPTSETSTDGDVVALNSTNKGELYVKHLDDVNIYNNPGTYDTFGYNVVSSPNNDIDVQFFRGIPNDLLDLTVANGASGTSNSGGALFSSSTNANGSIQGVTNSKTVYRSGGEIYVMFTAAFTAGIANSYMRIGLYDANDGVFIGYEGTSFGVTYRKNTSDTSVAKGSFSEDTLTGASDSRFTRNGTPEAIDLTKLNIYRFRFGWLGSAPVYWEVMSPDGHWVTFHKTLFPNLQTTPSLETADLPITLDITKTAAAATDLTIQTNCWGAGSMLSEKSGIVDLPNSRTASLLSNGTSWNASGSWTDVHRYALTTFSIYSSTSGAQGTLTAQFSMDGSTVHRSISYDVTDANTHPPHTLVPIAQYLRITYTADGGGAPDDHADFTVQTIHHVNKSAKLTSRVTSTINNTTDVDNVRSVIVGQTGGGSYVNVGTTNGGSLKIDVQEIGENTVDLGNGAVGSGTQRVTIASDTTGVLSVDDNGGSLTVDGTVTANLSATDNAVLDQIELNTSYGDNTGGGVEAGALRVTIANDSTGVLTVDDGGSSLTVDGSVTLGSNDGVDVGDVTINNAAGASAVNIQDGGNSITVDGTVTANLSATDNAVLDQIELNTSYGDNTGGGTEAGALRVTIANDSTGLVSVDDGGSSLTVDGTVTIEGTLAHDAPDADNPVKVGHKAIAHGTNPTAVAASDVSDWYTNRHGIPWVIGGHPNIVTVRANYTAAQTDTAVVTIAGGLKIVVTRVSVTADNNNSVDVQARIGFGATTTPTTTGVVLSHPGIAAGSGVVEGTGAGMLGVGGDGEDLRITSEVPTGGSIDVVVSYYTIES